MSKLKGFVLVFVVMAVIGFIIGIKAPGSLTSVILANAEFKTARVGIAASAIQGSPSIGCGDMIVGVSYARKGTLYEFDVSQNALTVGNDLFANQTGTAALIGIPILGGVVYNVINYFFGVKEIMRSYLPKLAVLKTKDPRVIVAGALAVAVGLGIGYTIGYRCMESRIKSMLGDPVVWKQVVAHKVRIRSYSPSRQSTFP